MFFVEHFALFVNMLCSFFYTPTVKIYAQGYNSEVFRV